VVITARGTDVSLIPRFARPRRLIKQAIAGAAALITVSAALKEALMDIGAPACKVTVLRNGVDTAVFCPPEDRAAIRASLGVERPLLVSVGSLTERKGHHRTIEAMSLLPGFELMIVGEGPEHDRLSALISRFGLTDRVRLLGARPHAELPALYGAADASVLSSSREGWANVLLESMACGTPVVASPIRGNPEVVRSPAAGVITRENSAHGIAEGVRHLFAAVPSRAATRDYAEMFSWDETTAGQLALFRRVASGGRGAAD
jgi:teichuronic acid biosynthesis glycosyltransferase TuaC